MKQQNGNVLFIILITIALFGALSLAVMESGRSGQNIDQEKTLIGVSEMIQYAEAVSTAIGRMKFLHDCQYAEISFDSDAWPENIYENATGTNKCSVFHPDGGGLSVATPPQAVLSDVNGVISHEESALGHYFFDSRRHVVGIGADGDAARELLIRVQVTEAACQEINKRIRGTTSIPTDNFAYWQWANNTVVGSQSSLGTATHCPECENRSTMCFLQTGGTNDVHQFYHVVYAR